MDTHDLGCQPRIGSPTHVALPLRLVLRRSASGFCYLPIRRAPILIGFGDMTKRGLMMPVEG